MKTTNYVVKIFYIKWLPNAYHKLSTMCHVNCCNVVAYNSKFEFTSIN